MRREAGRSQRQPVACVLALLLLGAACQASASARMEVSPSSGAQQAWKTYRDGEYGIVLKYPADWQAQWDDYDVPHFEGKTGFVHIDILNGGRLGLRAACRFVASHSAHPYGTHPRLSRIYVDGRRACLIWPSRDQSSLDDDAAAVLVPRHSEPPDDWRYLKIDADKGHIRQIAVHAELFTADYAGP